MKTDLPIRVYAGFECLNIPIQQNNISFKQVPIAVGYYIVTPWENKYYSYFGFDCVKWFVNEMLILEQIASNYFETDMPLLMTEEDEKHFNETNICWLCEQPINIIPKDEKDKKSSRP